MDDKTTSWSIVGYLEKLIKDSVSSRIICLISHEVCLYKPGEIIADQNIFLSTMAFFQLTFSLLYNDTY